MINIDTLEFRNFMTYGDYVTKLPISEIGPALIVGKDEETGRSNGAGKTTIPEAIIWCLFGRLTKKPQPGDNIVNWNVGKDCYVEITTKSGHTIRRTRKMVGHSDLLITNPDGSDVSTSINDNAQTQLLNLFKLDYSIFTAGSFFGQFGQPVLELSEPKRRSMIERMLHISYLDVYAKVAKEKKEWSESEQGKEIYKRNQSSKDVENLKDQIEINTDSEKTFERKRLVKTNEASSEIGEIRSRYESRIKQKQKAIKEVDEEIGSIKLPDKSLLVDLERKWDIVSQIETILGQKQSSIIKLEIEISAQTRSMERISDEIEHWADKADTTCSKCRQPIQKTHTDNLINPLKKEQQELKSNIDTMQSQTKEIDKEVEAINTRLQTSKPQLSVDQLKSKFESLERRISDLKQRHKTLAEEITEEQNNKENDITKAESKLEEIRTEQNPYGSIASNLKQQLSTKQSEVKELELRIDKLNILIKHLNYIQSAYRDRKKLRSFILSNSIPFFNRQIAYYLNAFNLGLSIEFNTFLQTITKQWPYYMFSGGESRRTDLAIMLAIHDLHASMYGRMSNILVFDEVDGRLCDEGIDGFLRILFDDIDGKEGGPETILVISHRQEMKDAFPTKIVVTKRNNFSHIEEIR